MLHPKEYLFCAGHSLCLFSSLNHTYTELHSQTRQPEGLGLKRKHSSAGSSSAMLAFQHLTQDSKGSKGSAELRFISLLVFIRSFSSPIFSLGLSAPFMSPKRELNVAMLKLSLWYQGLFQH